MRTHLAPILILGGLFAAPAGLGASAPSRLPTAPPSEIATPASFGRLPLHFEANCGQTDPAVRFLARALLEPPTGQDRTGAR